MNFTDKTLSSTLTINYGLAAISAIVPLICIPFYINLIGLAEWAYVGYLLVVQGLFSIIDSGILVGLIRIFSIEINRNSEKYDILRTLELLMFLFLLSFSILIALPCLIAIQFDIIETEPKVLASVIGGLAMYIVLALSIPHKAFLLSNNRQVSSNGLTALILVMRHSSAIFIMNFFPSVLTFIYVHLFFALVETIWRMFMSWSNQRKHSKLDLSIIKSHKTQLSSITGSTIIGAAAIHIDKIIAAAMLSGTDFAKYTIAATIGIGMIQLFSPIFGTTQPRYLEANGNNKLLSALNLKISLLLFSITLALWVLWLSTGTQLVNFYLGANINSEELFGYISIFLFGSTLYAVGGLFQNNVLSHGLISTILHTNIGLVVAICLFQPFFIEKFGINGACMGWVSINILSIAFYSVNLFRVRDNKLS